MSTLFALFHDLLKKSATLVRFSHPSSFYTAIRSNHYQFILTFTFNSANSDQIAYTVKKGDGKEILTARS